MKIAVLTIKDLNNYGNQLQTFATNQVLKQMGAEILFINFNQEKKISKKKLLRALRKPLKYSKVLLYCLKQKLNQNISKRRSFFSSFYELRIKAGVNDENLYDFYIVGSDQVWNYNFAALNHYFLNFCEPQKRIAYAASFGVEKIPEDLKEYYRCHLEEIPNISVREDTGAQIVKNLTGRDVPVLIDPTLMLDKEEWLKIAKASQYKPKSDYLVAYFLGSESKKLRKECKKLAKEFSLEVVDLYNIRKSKYYINGPSEFIDYINDCQIVITNSFHGAVFSILFEKPFILYEREGMNSRIDTLLSTFNLEDRKWDKEKLTDKYFSCDYGHIKPILEKEREKAYSFLKDALKINDV